MWFEDKNRSRHQGRQGQGTFIRSTWRSDHPERGLDGLVDRLAIYKGKGARFAKWREVYPITPTNPTRLGLHANLDAYLNISEWIQDNLFLVLLIAVLVGIIQESGKRVVTLSMRNGRRVDEGNLTLSPSQNGT